MPAKPAADFPAIRALELQRIRGDVGQEPGVALIDRLGISEPTFIPEQLLPIVARFDGTASLQQIQRAASTQIRAGITLADVAELARQLDDRLLLLGPRFDAAATAAARTFAATGVRTARHTGSAGCPSEPAALRAALQQLVRKPAGAHHPLRGLIAPHIDLARGAAGYRSAYERLLAAPPADLYVVFGTGHAGPSAPVTGLGLDWQTPIGTVTTDRRFVDAVHSVLGAPAPTDMLQHRDEHSLEFQMLFLQHLHERRASKAAFAVAGFLCGSLPSAAGDPLAEAWCQRLLGAFLDAENASGLRVCYLAGADLAHIGPMFGDTAPVDTARLDRLAAAERQRLQWLENAKPGAFHAAVDCAANPDRVCSAPAITLCAALAGGSGELLHYGQAPAADGSQAVSFCAMSFAGGL